MVDMVVNPMVSVLWIYLIYLQCKMHFSLEQNHSMDFAGVAKIGLRCGKLAGLYDMEVWEGLIK